MRLPFFGLFTSACLTLTAVPALGQTNDAALATRLDAAIDKALSDKRIVGTVVMVARDGKIVYHRAAGLADREAGTPMRENAIFRYASVTKPFTSIAFMRLVEQGRVKLSDPVTKYLPNFTPRMADGTTPTITLRQLLTHTAGLSYRFSEAKGSVYDQLNISDGLDQPGLGLDDNLKRLVQAPLSYAPGTSWRYSLGIDVIGAVIEKVTGKSLSTTVGQFVTTPLRLRDTRFSVTDTSRLATPYADGKPEPVRMTDGMYVPLYNVGAIFAPSRILDRASYPSGGGGMAGTASDLLRVLETVRTGGGVLLKPATVALMTQDQIGAQAQSQGPGWGFGYGWGVLDDPAAAGSPQSKGTFSWAGAYGHTWFVDPAQRLTVVAFTNTAFEGISGKYPIEVRDAVYGVAPVAK